MRKLIHLSVGFPKAMEFGDNQTMETGICKEAVDIAFLAKGGFQGDSVANTKYHGGPDRAVCIYPYEHYSMWGQEFGLQLPPAAFGENVTVTHMTEHDVCLGDIYQIGEAVIQVTQGRIPCDTISKRLNIPTILSRIVETGYTGYLCRVLTEGYVRKESPIKLLRQHPAQISVLYANEVYFLRPKDAEAMEKILEVEELADVWREKLRARLHALKK
ncbi:MAG: MOSC domain-containing protein [Ectobacillus sp.]